MYSLHIMTIDLLQIFYIDAMYVSLYGVKCYQSKVRYLAIHTLYGV